MLQSCLEMMKAWHALHVALLKAAQVHINIAASVQWYSVVFNTMLVLLVHLPFIVESTISLYANMAGLSFGFSSYY